MNTIPGSIDNKKYSFSDLAPIGCEDCAGCSECCHEMGDSIIQDPYDLWNFCSHMKISGGAEVTFDLLISEDGPWELSEQDTLLLPNLKMVEPGVCSFLNEQGRCSIHQIRSGLCRLYPLGRIFEAVDNQYQLSYYVLDETLGCHKQKNGTPVLISEWLGIPNMNQYEKFQIAWHDVKAEAKEMANQMTDEGKRSVQELLLRIFYSQNYKADFYSDFYSRIEIWQDFIRRIRP